MSFLFCHIQHFSAESDSKIVIKPYKLYTYIAEQTNLAIGPELCYGSTMTRKGYIEAKQALVQTQEWLDASIAELQTAETPHLANLARERIERATARRDAAKQAFDVFQKPASKPREYFGGIALQVHVSVTPDIYAKIESARKGLSLAEIIRRALDLYFSA